jgi:hypothetical protein
MKLGYTKCFLKVFLLLLDRKKDRAALRFLYRHTTFQNIHQGDTLFETNNLAANGKIIYVAKGLVNGYITDENQKQANIWLGRTGSTYISDDFSYIEHTFNILAIEHSTVLIIDKYEFEEGCAWYPALDALFHSYFLRNALTDVNNRNIFFRLQNIENKTRLFKRIYPGLYERIPAKLLMSYLEMDSTLKSGQNLQSGPVYSGNLSSNQWPSLFRESYLD